MSGAMYGVGMAAVLCMGLFSAGLSLSLNSTHRLLATCHGSIRSYQQPPFTNHAALAHSNR